MRAGWTSGKSPVSCAGHREVRFPHPLLMDIKLEKVRKIVFNREDEDTIYITLQNKDDEVVFTGEPRVIRPGETYILNFGHDVVIGTPSYDALL